MTDKTTEERLDKLEQAAHMHVPGRLILGVVDCNPEQAEQLNEKKEEIYKAKLAQEDIKKGKKKGSFFGDPIVDIE